MKKANERLYFLYKLSKFKCKQLIIIFYGSPLEFVLIFAFIPCFSNLSLGYKNRKKQIVVGKNYWC